MKPLPILLIISVILALVAILALTTTFGDRRFGPNIDGLLNRDQGVEEVGPVYPPEMSTAARILARGEMVVGVLGENAPFGERTASGELAGFDVDIAHELARRIVGNESALHLVEVTESSSVPQLVSNQLDAVVAGLKLKREREQLIDFTQTYFVGGQGILVRNDSLIESVDDLDRATVAVLQGSEALDNLRNEATQRNLIVDLVPYQQYRQALAALSAGQVDAFTADAASLIQFARENPGLRLASERFLEEPYGIGVRQGDSQFRELVNYALQDMKRDGTYDAIYERWFSARPTFDFVLVPQGPLPSLAEMEQTLLLDDNTRLQDVLSRGRLVAGIRNDLPPFGEAVNNRYEGFDVDLIRELARRWLGDANAVDFVAANPAQPLAALIDNEVDLVAAGIANQRDWAQFVDFSQTYVGPPTISGPLSLALPQDDPTFRELVNVTLQEMKADGTYDAIFARWFGAETPVYPVEVLRGDASYLFTSLASRVSTAQGGNREATIQRIRNRGNTLVVGVGADLQPFGFLDARGNLAGFDVDLVRAVADLWDVQVRFEQVGPADRVQKLVTGDIDLIAAALPHTKEREAAIDFSQTYFRNGQSLLVRADSGFDNLSALEGRTVAALRGSAAASQIQTQAEARDAILNVLLFANYEQALSALRLGQVDAVTADRITLAQFANQEPNLVLVGESFVEEPYGLGLPAGDSHFANLINFSLQTLKEQGLYDELYREWFGEGAEPYPLATLPGDWPYTLETAPPARDVPEVSRADFVLEEQQLRVGVRFDARPFGYFNESDQLTGFDIELMREFSQRWLGDEAAIQFVQVSGDEGAAKIAAGEVDMLAAGVVRRREAAASLEFSETYLQDGQTLLTRAGSAIEGPASLGQRTVGAIQGREAGDALRDELQQLNLSATLLLFESYDQALAALRSGQIEALADTGSTLAPLASNSPDLSLVDTPYLSMPYALGLPLYDDRFRDLVNFTLQEMQLDGTYERLHRRWFGAPLAFQIETWPGDVYHDIQLTPMARVPAGEFIRGNEAGFPDEQPVRTIYLDEYYIDQYEVTNRLYNQCVQAGFCAPPGRARLVNFGNYYAESAFRNFPVIWVTWEDAANYCEFAGKRLPTEAEWEKAARGEQGDFYPWGSAEPAFQANYDFVEQDVAPVGQYSADRSPYGAYDMAGNAREWVADWYQWDYYANAPGDNPPGPESGVTKVLRGGSWNDAPVALRASIRKNFLTDAFDANLGFRCASSTFPARQAPITQQIQ